LGISREGSSIVLGYDKIGALAIGENLNWQAAREKGSNGGAVPKTYEAKRRRTASTAKAEERTYLPKGKMIQPGTKGETFWGGGKGLRAYGWEGGILRKD